MTEVVLMLSVVLRNGVAQACQKVGSRLQAGRRKFSQEEISTPVHQQMWLDGGRVSKCRVLGATAMSDLRG